ncbi:MAG: BatD family protein [Candidatus Omnitrophota bacterium]|nr:BatD family protein [Candidatus Omnitrophota bacterium]
MARKTIVLLLLLMASGSYVFASDIQFEITVDRKTVSLGKSLQLNLLFHGTQSVSAPDIGEIEGFQMRYLGPSTRMSIVNGRVSSSITHSYTLIPLKTGKLEIGPLSVVLDGKTFTSQTLTIEAVSGPSPPAGGAQESAAGQETISEEQLKDRIFLTIEAEKSNLFVNESIPLSIKLYINRLGVRDIQYPKFGHEGFSIKEFGQPERYRRTIGGIVYNVIEFNANMFAVRPGELSLGPARVDCNLVVRKQRRQRRSPFDGDFFGSDIFNDFFGRYETYPFQVASPALTINVQPLPLKGKPPGFKEAVGDFRFEAEVLPKELKAGDPITVTMTVSGAGNFDTVTNPVLGSKEGFKIYEPQAKQNQSTKVFEQVLIPQSEAITEIPKINFSFFNPQTKEYRSLTQGPFPISVAKPEGGELKIVEIPQAVAKTAKEELLGRDIVYIKESPGKLKRIGRYRYQRVGFWICRLVTLIIFIGLVTFHKHQEKLKTDERYARRLQAPAKARKGISEAQRFLGQEKSGEFFDCVHKTLIGYLADKLHLPAGGITIDAVREILENKKIDGEILDKLTNIFSACDMARYAPLEFGKFKIETVFNDMRKVIDFLERKKV